MSVALESSPDLLARFSVNTRLEVRAAIEDLLRGRAPISLYPLERGAGPLDTRLLAIEHEALLFELGADDARAHRIVAGGRVTVVGLLDRVKVQFDASRLRVRDGGSMLACPLPEAVSRIQRRDAYRVRPPQPRPAQCVMRAPDHGNCGGHVDRVYAVLDISATGVALKIPPDEAAPAIGQRWQHCRVEAAGYPPIPCELEARFLGECLSGETPGPRLGCVFVRPPPEVQRALQVYVMDVERGRPPPEPDARPACS